MKQVTDAPSIGKSEREILLQRIGVELSHLVQSGDPKLDKILEHLRVVLKERLGTDRGALTKVAEMLFHYLQSRQVEPAVADSCQPLAETVQALLQEMQVPMANYGDAQQLAVAAGRAKSQDEVVAVLERGIKLLRTVNGICR